MTPLTGQTAIITGASAPQGIGRAIAHKLAEDGANIVVTDIDAKFTVDGAETSRSALLAALVDQLTASGTAARALVLDVTSAQDVQACVAHTLEEFGSIDILVNNAGSTIGAGAFLSTTPEQWETSFEINLLGPLRMAQAVIPHMRAQGGGRIINIGSTGSLGAAAGFGAYTTMKHGLVGLSKTIAAEFGPDGILCNTVCPGYIATDMHMAANARLAREAGIPVDQMKAQRYADVALRDAGQPQDVAHAVAYLAGPAARYVTGINLPVSGGVPPGL